MSGDSIRMIDIDCMLQENGIIRLRSTGLLIGRLVDDVKFEDVKPRHLTFGQALEALVAHHKVARAGWNGKGMHVEINTGGDYPDAGGMMRPFFVIKSPGAAPFTFNTWVPSVSDLLATDWMIV